MIEAARMFRNVREFLTPQLTESAFRQSGVITPEEFIKAGDHLISCCPSWQWCAGGPSGKRPYLPSDKQFLITKGVPSYQRVRHMNEYDNSVSDNTIPGGLGDVEGDWEAPTLNIVSGKLDDDEDSVLVEAVDLFSLEANREPSVKVGGVPSNSNTTGNACDEYADLEDEAFALDEVTLPIASTPTNLAASTASTTAAHSKTMSSRRYDVSITYDNYWRTARLWLLGYDENGSPLSPEAMFEDVILDYRNKTVTIEPHPHVLTAHASIHPCNHATAMLKIIEALKDCTAEPSVDQYMFIFLKFIQGVIPTIEYDNTMDVQIRKRT